MKKIFLETFGCQMNVLDSELVEGQLKSLGYVFTSDISAAQVVLYNTCSVRELAEQKVYSRLGRLRVRKVDEPELVIGVIGCMAERDGVGMLKRLPHVDLMCGPGELDQLPHLLENVLATGKQQHALAGNTSRRSRTLDAAQEDGLELLDLSAAAFRPSIINIIRHISALSEAALSSARIAWCLTHAVRKSAARHRPFFIDEARRMVDAGCLEITLLGQTVNHYVHEETVSTPTGPAQRRTTFAELLHRLHDSLPDLPRLRFLTSFPADFGDDILHVMAQSPAHLPLSAHSGSIRIGSHPENDESRLHLRKLPGVVGAGCKRIVPDIVLAGDIIVGFPTETEEDFQATCKLVELGTV